MKVRLTGAVVVLALAVGSSGALAAPTKNQFIWRGDALCERVYLIELQPIRDRAMAAKSLRGTKRWVAAEALWRDQLRVQTSFIARFRAIGVPRGDATARSLVEGLDRGVVLARQVLEAFASRRIPRVAPALKAYLNFTFALNERVQAYGFAICGGT